MDKVKEHSIRGIIKESVSEFATAFNKKHSKELKKPDGVINSKKKNSFMAILGEEFIYYSALVRSFDSSFGNLIEKIGNLIAQHNYQTKTEISSFLLKEQSEYIDTILNYYHKKEYVPSISHYANQSFMRPTNIDSFKTVHQCDNWFYDKTTDTHYLIELKAGGDLDIKKAQAEKKELLNEYFMLKNLYPDKTIKIHFATAYNKYGEGNPWSQSSVETYFAKDELLIGKDYWNFVCKDEHGFDIIFDEYKKSAGEIVSALSRVKNLYFPVKKQ